MDIRTLRCADNFIYLLLEGRHAAVLDPRTAEPFAAALRAQGCTLEWVLITHHHADHTGGVAELRDRSKCRVLGPPGGLAEEKKTNPFLRCRDAADFARVRARKDVW
jgi:glyoxylase-like metal-dependent hydrolase (beta-lactamase superfamily II)